MKCAALPVVMVLGACGGGDAGLYDASISLADAAIDAPIARPWPDAGPLRACETQVTGPAAPVALADLAVTASQLAMPAAGDGRVHDLAVTVDILHSYPRDLEIALTSPAGKTVVLARGASGFDRVTFADGSALPSLEPLAGFDGEPLAGAWTLKVADRARGDRGTLLGWSLRASACAAPACATSTRRSESVRRPTSYHTFDLDPAFRAAGARVEIDVQHDFDEDLRMVLSAPGRLSITLSNHNGGLGSNYLGTIFDDTAPLSIRQGLAPFTGRFRPEEPLAKVADRPAAGTWAIEITGVDYEELVQRAVLEVDLCDLPCPAGSTPASFVGPGGAAVDLQVPTAGTVAAAAVRVSAAGEGPMSVVLRAPTGKTVTLAEASPGVFDDALFVDWATRSATDGAAPWSGPRHPVDPLAAMTGESAAGTWTVVADGGVLGNVTLQLCTR